MGPTAEASHGPNSSSLATAKVNAVPGAQLASLLPQTVNGMKRTDVHTTCCGLPGMTVSNAVGTYIGPGGPITLTVTDMADERGMLALLSIQQNLTSSDGSFQKVIPGPDGPVIEKHVAAQAGKAQQNVCEKVVARRFLIAAQGPTWQPLCPALEAVNAGLLPSMARAAGVPGH